MTENSIVTMREYIEGQKNEDDNERSESIIEQPSGKSSCDDIPSAPTDIEALERIVERFIQDQLSTSINRNKPLYVADVGNQLLSKYGAPPVHKRLGYKKLEDLLLLIPSINLIGKGGSTIVVRPQIQDSHGDAQNLPPESPVRQRLSKSHLNDLRKEIRAEVLKLISTPPKNKPSVSLAFLGNMLAKRFGPPLTYRRLGFSTLTELIKSYDEFDVDAAGNVVSAFPR